MPEIKKAKVRCRACLDTKINSRGGPCAACQLRQEMERLKLVKGVKRA